MPVDKCLHKFGFSVLYIYDVFSSMLYENPLFLYIHS